MPWVVSLKRKKTKTTLYSSRKNICRIQVCREINMETVRFETFLLCFPIFFHHGSERRWLRQCQITTSHQPCNHQMPTLFVNGLCHDDRRTKLQKNNLLLPWQHVYKICGSCHLLSTYRHHRCVLAREVCLFLLFAIASISIWWNVAFPTVTGTIWYEPR